MSTYVYGIVRASHPSLREDLDGIGDPPRPVRVLRQGELAAIVSDAPDPLRPKRRYLLAHQAVLDEAGTGGVVLPMRFGSAAPDDDTVTAVLAGACRALPRATAGPGRHSGVQHQGHPQ